MNSITARFFSIWNVFKRRNKGSVEEENSELRIELNYKNILEHDCFNYIYEKVKDNFGYESRDKFNFDINQQIDKMKPLVFNFKNSNMYLNNRIVFNNVIYSDNYFYLKGALDKKAKIVGPSCFISEGVITIRICVIGGIFKIQVGEFCDLTTTEFISKEKYFEIYRKFKTVCSFPLLFFPYSGIPSKYLNCRFLLGAEDLIKENIDENYLKSLREASFMYDDAVAMLNSEVDDDVDKFFNFFEENLKNYIAGTFTNDNGYESYSFKSKFCHLYLKKYDVNRNKNFLTEFHRNEL